MYVVYLKLKRSLNQCASHTSLSEHASKLPNTPLETLPEDQRPLDRKSLMCLPFACHFCGQGIFPKPKAITSPPFPLPRTLYRHTPPVFCLSTCHSRIDSRRAASLPMAGKVRPWRRERSPPLRSPARGYHGK